MYYAADGQRAAMRVSQKPVPAPQPTPTPGPTPTVEPYPAPASTPSAAEGIFSRFAAFLKDLFGVQPAYAAATTEVTAPVGEVCTTCSAIIWVRRQ
jgi:hypothetical protein